MTLRSALILPLVPLLIGTAAQAQVLETRYTELVGGRCRFVSIDKQTNEGQLMRCPVTAARKSRRLRATPACS